MKKNSFVATRCPYCGGETTHRAKKFQPEGKTVCSICRKVYLNSSAKKTFEGWFEVFCKAVDEEEPIRLENELERDVD